MSTGFIKLYRSMLEWGWYDDVNTKVLFLHLLLKANYVEKEWHGELIKRGQLITSIKNLADELYLSEKQVRHTLTKLKKTGEISTKGASKFTLITVEKYGFYQDVTEEKGEQKANKGRSEGNQEAIKGHLEGEQKANEGQQLKKERSEEREEVKEGEEGKKESYQQIADMYNATCMSFPKCAKLSEARKKAIKARLNTYTIEDFKQLFEIAERSNFLKGANDRNWQANFDWLTADKNMTKVLEGHYNRDSPKSSTNSSKFSSQNNPFFELLQTEGFHDS